MHAIDAAIVPYLSRGDLTSRERLDDWLTSPLNPAAEEAFLQNLMGD